MVKRKVKQVKVISKKLKSSQKLTASQKLKPSQSQEPQNKPQPQFVHVSDVKDGPSHFAEFYNHVVDLRRKFVAPVDTMGCERIPESITPGLSNIDPKMYRFQLLISLMLSSQTKDEVNFEAVKGLHHGLKDRGFKGLTLEAVLALDDKALDGYIGKVGFHNRKTAYIKSACNILQQDFKGDIPQSIEDVVKLPGVGPKMGYLLLQKAWNINDGIGVDVHIHRLANLWKWCNTSNPELTRRELELWVPKLLWPEINPLLVGFGQVICTPKAPNCDICRLSGCKAKRKIELTEERIEKLKAGRGDLQQLLEEFQV